MLSQSRHINHLSIAALGLQGSRLCLLFGACFGLRVHVAREDGAEHHKEVGCRGRAQPKHISTRMMSVSPESSHNSEARFEARAKGGSRQTSASAQRKSRTYQRKGRRTPTRHRSPARGRNTRSSHTYNQEGGKILWTYTSYVPSAPQHQRRFFHAPASEECVEQDKKAKDDEHILKTVVAAAHDVSRFGLQQKKIHTMLRQQVERTQTHYSREQTFTFTNACTTPENKPESSPSHE